MATISLRAIRNRSLALTLLSLALSTLPVFPAHSNGLGGYAVIHPDGHVCGVVVATSADPFGNGGFMSSEYMGCPTGSRFAFQTKPSPTGNVAGWHGPDVLYSNGVFRLSNGTTIVDGIATDPNGRVWDTGSGETITPAPSAGGPNSGTTPSDTGTVVLPSETSSTSTSDSQTVSSASTSDSSSVLNSSNTSSPSSTSSSSASSGTAPMISDSPSTTSIESAKSSDSATTNSSPSVPSASTSTSSSTPQTTDTPSSTVSQTSSVIDSAAAPLNTASTQAQVTTVPVTETVSDGIEENPTGDLTARRLDDGRYRIGVRTNLDAEVLTIRATKRGFKTIRFEVNLNENGRAAVVTIRDLSGYRLSLFFGDLLLDARRLP